MSYWKVLTRRKTLQEDHETDNKFNRVLTTFDLTTLGIGATLGVGVYVLAGHVAKDQAGPSVVLSFAIAAVASLLAGLCYAEFGARVPKAGSAYIYTYVCIGEFAAFIIGWNLILEYIIGSASVSRGLSLYLDTLINDTLKTTFLETTPINWDFMGPYFDFLAFSIAFIIGISLAFGIHTSTMINNVLTILNIAIILFVIIAGSINADPHNWKIDPEEVKEPYIVGSGGFFPFGFEGTLRGAATCFFGFVGFDCIATTGEEVKNPRRSIPRAILFSLLIIFLSYFGVSTVLTLMWPYYLQNVDAPLPFVFQEIQWPVAKWIVTIGGMIGLIASLFGAMFPLPRIIYAMAQDGLIFRHLGNISPRFNTPVAGNIWAAFLTGLMAAIFDLTQLVNMLSIGTLMAYTVVAVSITILRFTPNENEVKEFDMDLSEESILAGTRNRATCKSVLLQLFNLKRLRKPTYLSSRIVEILLLLYCLFCLSFSLIVMYAREEIRDLESWAIGLLGLFIALLLLILLAISLQPREKVNAGFRVPLVPLIPGISIFVNIYLMLQLDIYTWIRFGVWMAMGLPIYLISVCMYNNTEVRNFDVVKAHLALFQNGKINKYSSEYVPRLNGTITSLSMRNEMSENDICIKPPSPKQSLDEILPAAEVAGTLKEVKNSNGKVFFIEESDRKESDKIKQTEDEEDPKSVIAILDNVLQIEDTEGYYHDFNRKTSVDSEMIPSFVETSTVAMVHSPYFIVKEEEEAENIVDNRGIKIDRNSPVEELSEEERIVTVQDLKTVEEDKEIVTAETLESEDSTIAEAEVEVVEPIENKEEIEDHFEGLAELFDYIKKEVDVSKIENNTNHLVHSKSSDNLGKLEITTGDSDSPRRKSSQTSDKSHEEDAIHSKSFKAKLNLLLAAQPTVSKPIKQTNNTSENSISQQKLPPVSIESSSFSKLKPSKSEPDLSLLFDLEINEDEQITNDLNKNKNDENHIPKPPKFDPILYNTVSSRHHKTKGRPALDAVIKTQPEQPVKPISQPETPPPTEESEPISFKKKLEELLKRGPCYKNIALKPKTTTKLNLFLSVQSDSVQNSNSPAETTDESTNEQLVARNPHANSKDFKIQFTTVLQSIGPRDSADEIQVPKLHPATIDEAQQSLRPVTIK